MEHEQFGALTHCWLTSHDNADMSEEWNHKLLSHGCLTLRSCASVNACGMLSKAYLCSTERHRCVEYCTVSLALEVLIGSLQGHKHCCQEALRASTQSLP